MNSASSPETASTASPAGSSTTRGGRPANRARATSTVPSSTASSPTVTVSSSSAYWPGAGRSVQKPRTPRSWDAAGSARAWLAGAADRDVASMEVQATGGRPGVPFRLSWPPAPRKEDAQGGHDTVAMTRSADERARTRIRWELLANLVRKDLKVKYQGSVLGFLWSLANPLLLLVVYTFVFQLVLRSGIPQFGFFLLSGLLVWNAFSGAVGAACGAVVGNAGLVKKVRFPLAVLPLTPVGFTGVHFGLQLAVPLLVMLGTGYTHFLGPQLLLVLPALAVTLLFTVALCFLVSALNVRYRDTQHIVEVALMAGFWLNPIVYSVALVSDHLHGAVYLLYYVNPMAGIATTMQRALYAQDPVLPTGHRVLADPGYLFYLERLGIAAVVSGLLLLLGVRVYRRLSADFAEEL